MSEWAKLLYAIDYLEHYITRWENEGNSEPSIQGFLIAEYHAWLAIMRYDSSISADELLMELSEVKYRGH